MQKAKGLTVIDLESEMEFVTPAEIAGEDSVYISRLRQDHTVDNGLNFCVLLTTSAKGLL